MTDVGGAKVALSRLCASAAHRLDMKHLQYGPEEEDKAAVICAQACKFAQGDEIFEVENAATHKVFCRTPAAKVRARVSQPRRSAGAAGGFKFCRG